MNKELGVSIPALKTSGELPPGEHNATIDEVEVVFGSSSIRESF